MNPFKNRTIRFDILTIFLFLISALAFFIITFSYIKNSESILKIARRTIAEVSTSVVSKTECLLRNLERVPRVATGVFLRHPGVSVDNEPLISYFLDTIKYHPHLYSFYLGTPSGNFLEAWNLSLSGKVNYLKNAPEKSEFALLVIDRDTKVEELRYYSKNLELVGVDKHGWKGFDPRLRPWYEGAKKEGGLYWTDVFKLVLTEKTGVAISNPVFNEKKELVGVLGASLYLDSFSLFLRDQKISPNGQAFIINQSNKIIIPDNKPPEVTTEIIENVLKVEGGEKDIIVKVNGEKYLVSLQDISVSSTQSWKILIYAPFLDFFSRVLKTQHQTVWISLATLTLAAILVIYFASRISRPIEILVDEVDKIRQLDLESQLDVKSNIKEIALLNSAIGALRTALRSINRYLPKDIVKTVMEREHDIALGGEKREVTLLFSDIAGLTSIAESLPLEELNELLAAYFDGMSKVILKNQGIIDKYIGDSIMAFWNAPSDCAEHAEKACLSALECQRFVNEFNTSQREKGKLELKTRIGINTGAVIAGNIGTKERMNYTVIGDVVNTAKRVESANKIFQTTVIIAQESVSQVKGKFVLRPLDLTEIKGRKEKVLIYELLATNIDATENQKKLVELFSAGYEAFHSGKLDEAKVWFEKVREIFPEDYPTTIYLERLKS